MDVKNWWQPIPGHGKLPPHYKPLTRSSGFSVKWGWAQAQGKDDMNVVRAFVLVGLMALSAHAQAQQGDYCFDPYRSHYQRGTDMYWREQIAHWMQLYTVAQGELDRTEQNRQLAEIRIRYPVRAGVPSRDIPRLPQVLANATALKKYYQELNALALFCLNRASMSERLAMAHDNYFDAPPVKFRRPVPPVQR
jgi:hypothetical protein